MNEENIKVEKGKQKEMDVRERDYSRRGWDKIQICN
jgi:hypothetical protein